MAVPEVVRLHDLPPLTDIAGRLRHLADQVERGEIQPESAYVVFGMQDAFEPIFYGFGRIADRHGVAGVFAHVAHLVLVSERDA